jgi:small subunit ribosomal protein S20
MANHKSAIKRTRANEAKRQRNRYQAKTVRTMIKGVRETEAKAAGSSEKELPKLLSSIDKLAKKNIFHKNKASNLKSKLMKRANKAKLAPTEAKAAAKVKAPKAAKSNKKK